MKLRTILSTYQKKQFNFIETKQKALELESGNYKFALVEAYSIHDSHKCKELLQRLFSNGFFVLFVSPNLPINPIINHNIIYIKTHPKFMGLYTFLPEAFKKISLVTGIEEDGMTEARRVARVYDTYLYTDGNIPQFSTIRIEGKTHNKLKILFDTNFKASGRGLGDILMSTAIVKQIRKDFPDSHITYHTRPEGSFILKNNPNIDTTLAIDYNKTTFMATLDKYDKHYFLGEMTEDYSVKRNRQPRIDSMAELFNLKLDDKKPELFLTQEELSFVNQQININKRNIVFCIEGVEQYRNWKEEYLLMVLNKLRNSKFNLIVVGKNRLEFPPWVTNLTARTTLRQLFAVIHQCDLVVTTDNFVSHIAGAFEKHSIILYTTIPAEWRCAYYKNAHPIQSPVKCSSCWNKYRYKNREHDCNGECVDALTPKLIKDKIDRVIHKFLQVKRIELSEFLPQTLQMDTHDIRKINSSKIIFVSLWRRLGDCLFGIPVVKALRKKYPRHMIIWGTHYKYYDIVKNLPYIDKYVLFQGKVDEGWDCYLPSADGQILNFIQQLQPEIIYNLHVSPKFSPDLTRTKEVDSIVKYMATKLAGLNTLDTTLEYFPNIRIEKKVKRDFAKFRKNKKGVVTYNTSCFSIAGKRLYTYSQLNEILIAFEREGYRVVHIGHLLDKQVQGRCNYQFCSLDYLYYAVKYSNLFIGYDSGIRNLALTVPGSKVISIDNEQSILNKTLISTLSDSKTHLGVCPEKEYYLSVFWKGIALLEKKDITIEEYSDILKYQFLRRKEFLNLSLQKEDRGIK